MANFVDIQLKGRLLRPHKASVSPILGSRNVLTNQPWTFVSLWLRRRRQDEAALYWEQAHEFYRASEGLSPRSKPLLLYYCFMNAAKALLSAKGLSFDPYHGLKSHDQPGKSKKINIANVGVEIKPKGVLPSLAKYFAEPESTLTHRLQDLFFNMPFIHRTFCLTYKVQRDMFVPVRDCKYVFDRKTKTAFLASELSADWKSKHVVNRLPTTFRAAPEIGAGIIRSTDSVSFSKPRKPSSTDLKKLAGLHKAIRCDLFYINGTESLWYIKLQTTGPKRLGRQTPTLILAAMHRLSELSRYHPPKLAALLAGHQNWLITEFMEMSPVQFIDEVAAEITGHQFLYPNVRPAS